MKRQQPDKESQERALSRRRRPVPLAAGELVTEARLESNTALPLVLSPAADGVDLAAWGAANRESLETKLLDCGGILFRGFDVPGIETLQRFIASVSNEPMDYIERSSPRTRVDGNIYTSTEYSPRYEIFLHNENSYANVWPMKIFFHCVTPSQEGGETPIADVAAVYRRIDPAIRERLRRKNIRYVRNFGSGVGLAWQDVFQTSERSMVEEHCRKAGYEFTWLDSERLRTWRVGQAVARHPRSGDMLWFNHGAFFHVSTLHRDIRDALLMQFSEEDLPNNTYYGDGTPIEASVLDEIRAAYASEKVRFPWRKGDILFLDNMRVAHGRLPFKGPRKIVVGMAEPMTFQQLRE